MPRRRKLFVRHVGQLVAGEVHHHYGAAAAPRDPGQSLVCPQCARLTWRHTGHCVHCQVNLRTWWLRARLQALRRWAWWLVGGC